MKYLEEVDDEKMVAEETHTVDSLEPQTVYTLSGEVWIIFCHIEKISTSYFLQIVSTYQLYDSIIQWLSVSFVRLYTTLLTN